MIQNLENSLPHLEKKMNQKDLKIITYLRQDARMSLTKLSKKTRIPVSTLFDRLKANEEKLIVRHTTLLNFQKLGFDTRAHIVIKVNSNDRDNVREFLLRHQSINSVYRINNGFDFMIEGVFKSFQDAQLFMDKLEEKFLIEEKKTHFIIKDLKKESFMSDPEMIIC